MEAEKEVSIEEAEKIVNDIVNEHKDDEDVGLKNGIDFLLWTLVIMILILIFTKVIG